MVTMSGNWDNTTAVLRGRAGILTRIALPTLVLPPVVRDGWTAFAGTPTPMTVLVGGLLAVAALLIAIWGQLAITAVALDPATTQADAGRIASRRFGPALGVYAVAILAVLLLMVPVGIALAGSHVDWAAVSRGQPPQIAPGVAVFVLFYLVAFVVAAIVLGARLFVLNPVILAERLGLGAYGRSWSLTKGLTWRIIGVMLLFGIVWIIATSAAQMIVGIVLRLLLGSEALAVVQFVTAMVGAVIASIYMVVVGVFAAQLYVAVSGRRAAEIL